MPPHLLYKHPPLNNINLTITMSSEENKRDNFVFSDEEDRPRVVQSHQNPGFCVGDKVYVLGSDGSTDGPYVVAVVVSEQQCTLCLENGQTAKNGEVAVGSCFVIMDDQHATASHYAILIGIDAYSNGPLKSCVRDVQNIKECLERKLSLVDIQTLTASKSLDPRKVTPSEDPEYWPTCHNVTSALEMTTSRAKRGDFVYIHYSGHGTRETPCFAFSNQSTGDLALVLLELDEHTSREILLRGPRLAGLIKAMVDKGLFVTLVLDCCFSATVYRNGDPHVRYLPHDNAVTSTLSSDPDDNLATRDTRSSNRDASMRDNWLLDPDRYTIIAACGPHENAKGGSEISESGEQYGALSYFLVKTLSDHGLGRRHRDIHRHLCARFWESCVGQHPVLYGNEDQGFFSQVYSDRRVRSTCIVERDKSFQLLAGQAHGLHDGDQFIVSPPDSTSNCGSEERFLAKVAHAMALTSRLELLGTWHNIRTGWIAEPLTCLYLANFRIQLVPDLPHHDEWLAALKERSLGIYIDKDQYPALQVVLSNNNEYEVLGGSGRKFINLPTMPRDQTDAKRIGDVLEHLARFSMVKDLANETPTIAFRELFNIQMICDGKTFGPGEQIEVRHGRIVELVMENVGDIVLYAHVYDLGPFWGVKGILRGTYETIPPRNVNLRLTGMSSKKIKMTVPLVMREYGSCEDIIKIVITSQPTSFDSLELPNLDELAGANTGNRVSRSDNHVLEEWIALDFPIRTLL
ncbi:hypothetical protein EG329_005914 [Mollisiaceae sp. DMI_Dod_QoI]|nr:hypothetical protein EG329_005914 [Helotiales sp. DMI_Dod_QoI]